MSQCLNEAAIRVDCLTTLCLWTDSATCCQSSNRCWWKTAVWQTTWSSTHSSSHDLIGIELPSCHEVVLMPGLHYLCCCFWDCEQHLVLNANSSRDQPCFMGWWVLVFIGYLCSCGYYYLGIDSNSFHRYVTYFFDQTLQLHLFSLFILCGYCLRVAFISLKSPQTSTMAW